MNTRSLLAGTAIATILLATGSLPAAANVIVPIGGYTGPLQLNFNNYESFLHKTAGGGTAVVGTPSVGDENFGIFAVQSITVPGFGATVLWVSGQGGEKLVGVFNDITVATVTGTLANEKTTNTGGVFQLYMVPTAEALGDLGTAGYGLAGCAIGSLCYHGVTDTATGQPVLTLDLTPGIDGPGVTLTAQLNATLNPPTGTAAFQGLITGDPQFAPDASGKDSFCPNLAPLCPGHDNSTFALASQDPIIATAIPTPEPASLAVLGSGLLSLGFFGSRRKKKKAPDA